MLELINTSTQTIEANRNVAYSSVLVPNRLPCIVYNGGTQVKLRGIIKGNSCPCATAKFKVHFDGNISLPTGGTAGVISLNIMADGEPLANTTMSAYIAEAGRYYNVSADTIITVPKCCCTTVAVHNTSDVDITASNATFIIERIA